MWSINFCARLRLPDWNLFSLSKNSWRSRLYIHIKASLTSCQLFLSSSRKKQGLRCLKYKYKMVVDILFLLAGLVFSLDPPAPSNSENRLNSPSFFYRRSQPMMLLSHWKQVLDPMDARENWAMTIFLGISLPLSTVWSWTGWGLGTVRTQREQESWVKGFIGRIGWNI